MRLLTEIDHLKVVCADNTLNRKHGVMIRGYIHVVCQMKTGRRKFNLFTDLLCLLAFRRSSELYRMLKIV